MQKMKNVSIVVLLSLLFEVAAAGNLLSEVQGTWKADKEATIAALAKHEHWTPKRLKAIEMILGKTEILINGTKVTCTFLDHVNTTEPTVSEDSAGRLILISEHPKLGKQTTVIEIDGDAIWLSWPDQGVPFRERYTKAAESGKQNKSALATPDPP